MEQKQRRAKANPFGAEQEEEDELPSPPEIDDVLKAAEMAQKEQINPLQRMVLSMSRDKDKFICAICGNRDPDCPNRALWGKPLK